MASSLSSGLTAGLRRVTFFCTIAITLAVLWVLLVPMFSYEPLDSDAPTIPGTERALPAEVGKLPRLG